MFPGSNQGIILHTYYVNKDMEQLFFHAEKDCDCFVVWWNLMESEYLTLGWVSHMWPVEGSVVQVSVYSAA